ncbi:hypothetical protein SO802_012952 [Lithocarpus litseifolius]|uniref:HAT C-terminal dimerisation domain-containing protein n=1 Tax=Lithocarpus litseifolius TaxID=425828 RepID=A0AAW2D9P7_9ROSI
MRCCAHILILIVVEGLKVIDAFVAKVGEIVRYVKSSPNRNQTFMSFMERLGIESKSFLCLDVPTRWNSTYLMLETVDKIEKVFLQMDFEDNGYSSYFRTKEDSGGLGSPLAEVMVKKVKDLLYKLYNFYSSIHSSNVQEQSGSERTKLESDASDPYVMVHLRYERFLQVEQFAGCSNELEKYLAENCDGRKDVNFEILDWWRDNCSRYLVLSKVAKDVLTIPLSTVAYESAFSTGGRIVDLF